jgi:GxxExxY protein
MAKLLLEAETYEILGACFEVYRERGCGFREPIYQECLEMEFEMRAIPVISQPRLEMEYKGRKLKQTLVPDFLCHRNVILEIKALNEVGDDEKSQLLNYLKATGLKVGLLVNFGHHPQLEHHRMVAADHWAPPKSFEPGAISPLLPLEVPIQPSTSAGVSVISVSSVDQK